MTSVVGTLRSGLVATVRYAVLGAALAAVIAATAHPASAQAPPAFGERFDAIAERVEALYHDPDRIDWDAWRAAHRPAAVTAPDEDAWHRAMERAFQALGDRHSRWLGPAGPLVPPAASPSGPGASGATDPPPVTARHDRDLRVATIEVRAVTPGAAEAVREAAVDALRDGALGVILDLRGNRGGDTLEIGRIAAAFGAHGVVLEAWARGRDRWRMTVAGAAGDVTWTRTSGPYAGSVLARRSGVAPLPGRARDGAREVVPLAVLIDAATASAAEALAAVLREATDATVVGVPSAGRVEVARRTALPGGYAADLAVAELRAPGGAPLAPVRPDRAASPGGPESAGRDAAWSEAVRAVRGFRVGPGRWFRRAPQRPLRPTRGAARRPVRRPVQPHVPRRARRSDARGPVVRA